MTPAEQALASRLINAGLIAEAAARAAHLHLEGRLFVPLAPGITLAIDNQLLEEAP
jgi:hypothetical protein